MNPIILPREAHNVSRKNIDPEALKVLYGLQRAGFRAYLCGGGVRDLMLGLAPKDYDVATDASPEQVKKTFRNCRIIGRRFRLAHVFYREKIIEVSTFRRRSEGWGEDGDLLITDDNTFGTAEEDAQRRDFTVNGLFYDISTFSIIDYVGGLTDLKHRVIRSIGEPSVRFREDPVRMLRAVKLASRLNFAVDPADWDSIREHAEDICRSASPRLLEELLKILRGGAAEPSFRLLEESRLMDALLPELRRFLEEARAKETGADFELYSILRAMDDIKEEGVALANQVYLSGILAPWLVPDKISLERDAAQRLLERMQPLQERLSIGKRDSQLVRNILIIQHRIQWKWGKRPSQALLRRRAFPLAVDLHEVRARSRGETLPEELDDLRARTAPLWDRFGRRVKLLPGESKDRLPDAPRKRRRRRRGGEGGKKGDTFARVPTALALPAGHGGPQPSTDGSGDRRRRRRRRGGRRRRKSSE